MVGEKIRLNIDNIEHLLLGEDPEEGIRYIDVNYFSNEVKLFIRKKDDKNITVKSDTFRPFVWFKGFDFEQHFCWDYFAVHIYDYNEDEQSVLINGEVLLLSDKLEVVGESPDTTEVFMRKFIEDVNDRKKLCYKKMQEYNITITETITQVDQKIDRLENGFKFLVHINPPKDQHNYTNPTLAYTRKGNLKKIQGSFSNLIDFFHEGGLDMWKKSGVFLDSFKFKNFWATSTQYQKLLFFLGFPFKSTLFTLIDLTNANDSLIHLLETEEDDAFTEVNYEELCAFVQNVFNEKTKPQKVFDLLEKKIKDSGVGFIKTYIKELSSVLKLKIDTYKLTELIDNDFSFESKKGFQDLYDIYLENGIDVFVGEERYFFNVSPLEQYMIQKEKRLFKGFEEYTDLRIMTMDIETKAQAEFSHRNDAALFPHMGRIFKIGIMCNNGFETVLNADTNKEERQIIEDFFKIVMENQPDVFLTYNGEHFDFPFILKRYEMLSNFRDEEETFTKVRDIFKEYYSKFNVYINQKQTFNRRMGNLKVGGSSERYMQTSILGMNLCDTMFAVKRAAAINKSIPNFKLKDNIKHANLAKKNRVYVDGGKIGEVENSKSDFYLNLNNGDWFKYHKEIIFEQLPYAQSKIKKRGQATFVYGNENTLYIWDEKLDGEFMGDCINTLKFDCDIESYFNLLYEKFKNFDFICFQLKNFAGSWLKTESPTLFSNLTNKLKELRFNLTNKESFFPDKDFNNYKKTVGSEIIKQYLIDDLWETVKLDEHYSQATFLISKWLPTSYQRAATMGGASVWKLLLATYTYKYNLAVPEFDEPREFSGGLVSMLSCGYHGKSFKADFSSLYPAEFYEHIKTPSIDLFGVFKLFMYFGWSTRIKYKGLMNEYKEQGDLILSKKYEVRQLPIKILINSFYGMMGAAGVTPFADLVVAQGITCNGRQHLRHLIRWFTERGFSATIAHTDGVFFSINTADLNYHYIGSGANWLVTKDKEYVGIAAYVAEYNDLFMKGIMGLDIDEIVESVINFSKGNYMYLKLLKDKNTGVTKEKIEIVGGAVIKKTQSEYIAQFVEVETLNLLRNEPLKFINSYWDYVGMIANRTLKPKLIASKAKVKKTKEEYLEHIKGVNKNGRPLNRQVHMELLIQNGLDFELGETVYYINSGVSLKDKDSSSVNTTFATYELTDTDLNTIDNIFKSNDRKQIKKLLNYLHDNKQLTVNSKLLGGDLNAILLDIEKWKDVKYKVKNLKKGVFVDFIKTEYVINCSLVDTYSDEITVDYNTELYISKFNSAVHPLFVCFNPNIRNKLIITKPENKPFVLEADLKLVNGIPFEGHENTQTSYDDTMRLSAEEIEYWETVKHNPNDFMLQRK